MVSQTTRDMLYGTSYIASTPLYIHASLYLLIFTNYNFNLQVKVECGCLYRSEHHNGTPHPPLLLLPDGLAQQVYNNQQKSELALYLHVLSSLTRTVQHSST